METMGNSDDVVKQCGIMGFVYFTADENLCNQAEMFRGGNLLDFFSHEHVNCHICQLPF